MYDERFPPTPPGPAPAAIPQWFFGIKMNQENVWDHIYGWYSGLRVTYVYFGSPAAFRVEPGDIITRVDGVRVETYADFAQAVGQHPTGVCNMRVRDVQTGGFLNISNIQLAPWNAPGGGPGGPGGPAPGPGGGGPTGP